MRSYKIGYYTLVAILLSTSIFSSCKKDDSNDNRIIFNPKTTYGSVTDIDGNEYKTIDVGNHVWFAENLRTTHYNDGSPITYVDNGIGWTKYYSGAYCVMNNDVKENKGTYGALYNYFAIYDSRNVCPAGWHVPSSREWLEMAISVGGADLAGEKLKEAGSLHWDGKNDGDNSIGFTALPGGYRNEYGEFTSFGSLAYWWTSTLASSSQGMACYINNVSDGLELGKGYIMLGASVRCMEDEFSIKTLLVSDIRQTMATCGGNITSKNRANIVERGVCWSTKQNPTIADSKTSDGKGIGVYTSSLTGLLKNTTYFVRTYANNGVEVIYGNELTFSTHDLTEPTLTTTETSNINRTSVTSGGIVSDDGGLAVTARGVCWSTSSNPTIDNSNLITNGSGLGIYTCNLTGLSENTVYYIRAFATNSKGTAYGNEIIFKTRTQTIPILTTSEILSLGNTTATCGGNVSDDGYLTVIARGVCWSTSPDPTIESNDKTIDGSGVGKFTSSIIGLLPNTVYYVRAYATNSLGTAYGNQVIVHTYTGTVTDVEGNTYNTVTIGSQVWMHENLKTTKYVDGTSIRDFANGFYFWYDDSYGYKTSYGALYNHYAVESSLNLCPSGWHVPNNSEWNTLISTLGDNSIAGGKLKEVGLEHWSSPNSEASDESSFTGLPGGFRNGLISEYQYLGLYGYFWSKDKNGFWVSYYFRLNYNNSSIDFGYFRDEYALSVRCLKD